MSPCRVVGSSSGRRPHTHTSTGESQRQHQHQRRRRRQQPPAEAPTPFRAERLQAERRRSVGRSWRAGKMTSHSSDAESPPSLLSRSLTPSLTHSLTQSLSHSVTQSLTHSLSGSHRARLMLAHECVATSAMSSLTVTNALSKPRHVCACLRGVRACACACAFLCACACVRACVCVCGDSIATRMSHQQRFVVHTPTSCCITHA
jgi:hypothetical protein